MQITTIGIIGGGASGMMAAIAAARNGADVILLEKNARVGRKLLSTGNGRCNFTNEYMTPECFRSDHPDVIPEILGRFSVDETLAFFREIGVLPKSRNGYMYPQPDQASAVLDALQMELERLHVKIQTNSHVLSIRKKKKYFEIHTDKDRITVQSLILSSGSIAASKLGATGDGYQFAKQFGHTISPVVPALVQLEAKEKFFKDLAGIRIDAKVTAWIHGKKSASDQGEVQLTAYGISGIPVFQISRFVSKALQKKQSTEVQMDLFPNGSFSWLMDELHRRISYDGSRTIEQTLCGIFNQKLIPVLLAQSGISRNLTGKTIRERQLKTLVSQIKDFRVHIVGTKSFEHAQICAGGVSLTEISPDSMESLKCKGLYLTGELLDADGICGGYNLQWAWTTGRIAGTHAAKGKYHD